MISISIILMNDVRAVDLGLPYQLGILGVKGQVINAIPTVADLLIGCGLGRVAAEPQSIQKEAERKSAASPVNKAARPTTSNKAARPTTSNKAARPTTSNKAAKGR